MTAVLLTVSLNKVLLTYIYVKFSVKMALLKNETVGNE
jgi:hypothetical protein